MSRCPDCGVLLTRIVEHGQERVNLDPVSGRCVDCLAKNAKARVRTMATTHQMPRDVKLAQLPAHDDED